MEEWKDIVGFEGFYRVSNEGMVASCDRVIGRKRKGRILRQWYGVSRQPTVDLMVYGERYRFLVSRLVAQAFIKDLQEGDEVAHADLNKRNNKASNLRVTTHQGVMAITNKILCGFEFIAKHKMTREKVREYFDYKNGHLIWKLRPSLSVCVGTKAGFRQDEQLRVHVCGNTYMLGQLIYLWHFGKFADYVLTRNGNYLDCRIENLYPCSASQWAKISNRVKNLNKKS